MTDTPNMEEMYRIVDKIKELTMEYGKLQLKLSAARAAIINKVMSDTNYWIKGKPPSMSFIEKTYLVNGIDNVNLIEIMKEKENVKSELDYNKMLFEIKKLEVEIWRTQSANQRALT